MDLSDAGELQLIFSLRFAPICPSHLRCKRVKPVICPNIAIWQQNTDGPGLKFLLIWPLNDSLYIKMILFPAQLIEYTGPGVGGGWG